MKKHLILIFLFFVTFTLSAYAADKVKVTCDTIYRAALTEAPAESRYKAIEFAKLAALESAFGTVIRSQDLIITTDNGQHAMGLGDFVVNGVWLKDIREPEVYLIEQRPTELIYSVSVSGWARHIRSDQIEVDYRLLYNGCDKNRNVVRDNTFYSGDEMFLYFNAPVNGWLAVYLGDDDDERTMQCLLPYDGQDIGAYPILANHEYIFFSKDYAESSSVDYAAGLVMEARKNTDFNVLYVIFSTENFAGTASVENKTREYTTLTSNGIVNLMPRETYFKSFQNWLGNKYLSDPHMQVIKTLIAIKQK